LATAQGQAAEALADETAANLAANNNVIAQSSIRQNVNNQVQVQTQQFQDQLAYAEVGDEISMATTKLFSGKKLENPEKHAKRFKLNVVSDKLPADPAQNLSARLGYFAETLTDAASELFD